MKEISKLKLINRVTNKDITKKEVALILGVSDGHVRNIIKKVIFLGDNGIKYQNSYNKPTHNIDIEIRKKIIELKITKYNDLSTNFMLDNCIEMANLLHLFADGTKSVKHRL